MAEGESPVRRHLQELRLLEKIARQKRQALLHRPRPEPSRRHLHPLRRKPPGYASIKNNKILHIDGIYASSVFCGTLTAGAGLLLYRAQRFYLRRKIPRGIRPADFNRTRSRFLRPSFSPTRTIRPPAARRQRRHHPLFELHHPGLHLRSGAEAYAAPSSRPPYRRGYRRAAHL